MISDAHREKAKECHAALQDCVLNQGIGWFDSTLELELHKCVRRHGRCQCVALRKGLQKQGVVR